MENGDTNVDDVGRVKATSWVGRGLIVLVTTLALLPCVVSFYPEIYLDVDPRSERYSSVVLGLGPSGQLVWQWVSVVVGLAAVLWGAGRFAWWKLLVCLAVLLPLAMGYVWHGLSSQTNLLVLGSWLAAGCLGLAVFFLTQVQAYRVWMVGVVVLMLLPLGLDAVGYVFVEHPTTLATQQEQQAAFAASKGWTENSPAYILHQRRVMDNSALGAFGLSNVFGSVLAGFCGIGLVLFAGTALRWWRQRDDDYVGLVALGVLVLVGCVGLVLTQSKGAIGGLGLALGAVTLVGLIRLLLGQGRVSRLLAMWGVVGVVVLAFGVIFLRGAMGPPETIEGERSLLFRYHYVQAAGRIMGGKEFNLLWGVGPSGFGDLYPKYKTPINPEEVTSAHSMAVDWVTMLGLPGVVLMGVVLVGVGRAGYRVVGGLRTGGSDDEEAGVEVETTGVPRWVVALPVFLIFAVDITVGWMQYVLFFDLGVLVVTLLAAFYGLPLLVAWLNRNGAFVPLACLAGGLAVLVHGQIEMTFYQAASVPVTAFLVGLACSGGLHDRDVVATETGGGRFIDKGFVVGLMGLGLSYFVWQGYSQQALVQAAVREMRLASIQQRPVSDEASQLLRQAVDRLPDRGVLKWVVALETEKAQRLQAMGQGTAAGWQVRETLSFIDSLRGDFHRVHLRRMRAEVLERVGRLEEAMNIRSVILDDRPYSLPDHMKLADLQWQLGYLKAAQSWYHTALRLDSMSYLDPAKGLTPAERELIETRMPDAGEGAMLP